MRRSERHRIVYNGLNAVDEFLTAGRDGRLQVILTTLEPGGGTGDEPYTHESDEEVVIVLEGNLELWVGDEFHLLADGDSILPRHLNLSFVTTPIAEEAPNPWANLDLTGTLTDVTRRAVGEVERLKIREVMREADGNKGRAAEMLQISYKNLLAKLKEHSIE